MGVTLSRDLREQLFFLPHDILAAGCVYFDIRELAVLASVNHRLRRTVKSVLVARAQGNLSKIILVKHLPEFYATLHRTRSVVGGSIALAMISPSVLKKIPTSNVNVFTPLGMLQEWEDFLNNIGFVYSKETLGYNDTSRRTLTFYDHNRGEVSKKNVVVCEANGSSSLTPILSSRYTCQMTFFTRDHVYCMHPHFTPQLKTLHIARDITFRERADTARLVARGVHFIKPAEDGALCDDNVLCRAVVRVLGTRPHRMTQRPGDMVGFLSLRSDEEEFLRSKRVEFWLGGICGNENCFNSDLVADDES